MSIFFKILKMILITIISLVVIVVIIAAIFINTSPEFGGKHTDERKARYAQADNYKDGKFENLTTTKMEMGFSKFMSVLGDYIKGIPNATPSFDLPVEKIDSTTIVGNNPVTQLTWFGHSAFLLEIGNKNILIDPMLGPVPAPHPKLGRRRFNEELPIAIEKLPAIDAIIISHDHYDHLDYGSIQKLKEKTNKFYVPMGVGAHLESWGIASGIIHELKWWDEIAHDELKLVFTPSRHFSGRGISDRFSTLWGSWVIQSPTDNIYFSGDSGYDDHFKEIGEKYGPFDFAMMECGQYDQRWDEIHMFPEETAQAAVDVQAKLMMPIHWGSFVLALHSWTDPIERVTKKAEELNMPVATPKIGEPILLDSLNNFPDEQWWVK